MTHKLFWEPSPPNRRSIETDEPEKFCGAIARAFSALGMGGKWATDGRWIFDASDLPVLEAMAAVNSDYHQLVSAIEEHGRVRIWAVGFGTEGGS